ncbi:MAG TPA: hypothetical protein VGL10_01490, partial [Gammaproteobacteria bacterium]
MGTDTANLNSSLKLALLLLCCNLVQPAQAANSLEEISFNTLPGNSLQIGLRMSGPATEPLSFTIDNPP